MQASKVYKSILNQWMKMYNIPFSVGMVEYDEEKMPFHLECAFTSLAYLDGPGARSTCRRLQYYRSE